MLGDEDAKASQHIRCLIPNPLPGILLIQVHVQEAPGLLLLLLFVTEGETEAETKRAHPEPQGQPVLEQNEHRKPCSHSLNLGERKEAFARHWSPEEGHGSCKGWFLPGTLFEGTQFHQEGRSTL